MCTYISLQIKKQKSQAEVMIILVTIQRLYDQISYEITNMRVGMYIWT